MCFYSDIHSTTYVSLEFHAKSIVIFRDLDGHEASFSNKSSSFKDDYASIYT